MVRRVSDAVRVRRSTPLAPSTLAVLHERIAACERCPRLREYCKGIGERKRRAYIDQTYWARPVPGFGDPNARVLASAQSLYKCVFDSPIDQAPDERVDIIDYLDMVRIYILTILRICA